MSLRRRALMPAVLFGTTAFSLAACGGPADKAGLKGEGMVTVTGGAFGTLADGRKVNRWDVRNENGAGFTVMDLGATILTVDVPDGQGKLDDVVFGFDAAAPYLTDSPYFGATVGRYANRIANGKFTVDGMSYTLATNNGVNHLHGGTVGFDKRIWKGEPVSSPEGSGVRFTLVSADGEEGYPGEVTVSATYTWTADNRLLVDYEASTTKATPFNIAQHSYWNLGGAASATSVLDHSLMISASHYLPVSDTLIPTGERRAVDGTAFDFRKAKPIGRDIGATDDQLVHGKGYDHNWIVDGAGMRVAAVLTDPVSGRVMTVSTDQPGIQFYSGNFLDGKVTGKGGNAYPFRSAVALETQYFPDSPNQPSFPDATLRPGKPFKSRTIYAFTASK